jgi:hypothetical protein
MDLSLVIQLTNHTIVQANKHTHQNSMVSSLTCSSIGFLGHNAICQSRRIYQIMPHRRPEGQRQLKIKSNYTSKLNFFIYS